MVIGKQKVGSTPSLEQCSNHDITE